jgi:hypothetical protein
MGMIFIILFFLYSTFPFEEEKQKKTKPNAKQETFDFLVRTSVCVCVCIYSIVSNIDVSFCLFFSCCCCCCCCCCYCCCKRTVISLLMLPSLCGCSLVLTVNIFLVLLFHSRAHKGIIYRCEKHLNAHIHI